MKFTAVVSAITLASVAQAVTIVTPWANTTWTSGGDGLITWKSAANEANLKCDIQLMNGNAANANMVAYVTPADTPIACSAGSYNIHPLNDFAAGKYSIRIGQKESNTWAYSGLFDFQGKGTAKPLQLASSAPATTSGVANTASPVSGSSPTPANKDANNKPSGSGSAANASSSTTSGAVSVNAMSMIGMIAIAGVSTLAMSL